MGEGDMRVSGTCGCGGHEGVGDLFSGGLVCLIRILASTKLKQQTHIFHLPAPKFIIPLIEFLGNKFHCLFGLGFMLKKQKKMGQREK